MTIYQLHKYSGEWEDFRDRIIGSYTSLKRAEAAKIEAEAKEKELEEKSRKCRCCPLIDDDFADVNDLLVKHLDYCDKAELEKEDDWVDCKNYYVHWDEATFKIEAVNVEE